MINKQNRKLAAILFADIVNYTGLMQKDEAKAKEQLQKFRMVVSEQVAAFNGQIVNFYGDGCLAIFNSPLDATRKKIVLPPARYFRKPFDSAPVVSRATVYATALGVYELSINGQPVTEQMFTPGWSDYRNAYITTRST